MFQAIKKWFSGVKRILPKQPVYDVYHPRERFIYTYFDGKKQVKVDPLILYKEILSKRADIAINISVSESQSKDNQKAQDELIATVRDLFNVKPLADGGLTEIETIGLLYHFLIYCETIKKNSNLFQTPLQPSAASTSSSVEENQLISSSSDSGSTANAPVTAVPPKSPLASESPLASSTPD